MAAILLAAITSCATDDFSSSTSNPGEGAAADPTTTTLSQITSESSLPTTTVPDIPGGEGGVGTIPEPEIDYGPYEDQILGGAEMVPGTAEYTNWFYSCIAEHGFDVEILAPARAQVDIGEQQEAYDRAVRECDQTAVERGIIAYSMFDIPDEETLRLWYRGYVEVAMPCLREAGYEVKPPPSEDTWVENYPEVWHPHDGRIVEECTQDPIEMLIELGKRDEAAGRIPEG